MTISLKEITDHLDALEIRYELSEKSPDRLAVRFATDSYVDTDGNHGVFMVCHVGNEGEYFEIYAPNTYSTAACKYKSALFSCMLHVAFMTKHLQLEHDPEDGEVRFSIDVPVCDGTITKHQLDRMIFTIVRVLEEYHPVFTHAMSTGKIDFGLRWTPPGAVEEAAPTPPALSPDLQELIAKVGGLDNLEAMLAQQRASGQSR